MMSLGLVEKYMWHFYQAEALITVSKLQDKFKSLSLAEKEILFVST